MSQKTFNNQELSTSTIENRIYTIRGVQIMLDFHLAELYQVETKRLNEQVKRNSKRFPERFMFQLMQDEWNSLSNQMNTIGIEPDLRSQIATAKRRSLPYCFTEQGVTMLSAVLNSEIAVSVSIHVIDAFVNMRRILFNNSMLNLRLDRIELKQLETDHKFEQVFKALENKSAIPTQGVFFEGQVFDAYKLTSKIIRSAKKSIILIDNYIDEATLTHLAKKELSINVLLLSKKQDAKLLLDVKKANEQYGGFSIKPFNNSHDRFLIIDETEVYHLGASLKDLGKRWFAFSKMEAISVDGILKKISALM